MKGIICQNLQFQGTQWHDLGVPLFNTDWSHGLGHPESIKNERQIRKSYALEFRSQIRAGNLECWKTGNTFSGKKCKWHWFYISIWKMETPATLCHYAMVLSWLSEQGDNWMTWHHLPSQEIYLISTSLNIWSLDEAQIGTVDVSERSFITLTTISGQMVTGGGN